MKCLEECQAAKKPCKARECRMWISYPKEFNCCLCTVEENGRMTLREVADRLNISYVRVKRIEDQALAKLKTIYKEK